MYVEKFEADSLDHALKKIKAKLGPDAIILKTVTNKGIMGALKKKKIEITAAISEDNYEKKSLVDQAIGENLKEKFYQAPSSHVLNMIDNYAENREKQNQSYGKLALNKSLKKENELSGLDDFLGNNTKKLDFEQTKMEINKNKDQSSEKDGIDEEKITIIEKEHQIDMIRKDYLSELSGQQEKIDLLEKKIFELTKQLEKIQQIGPKGIFQVRTTLQSFGLNESFISKVLKEAIFELGPKELEEEDAVLEITLREVADSIYIDLPLFSNIENQGLIITILLSESSMGQTSTAYKLSSIKENSILIRFSDNDNRYNLSKKMFNITEKEVFSLAEIVVECRKAIDDGKNVFVDYKSTKNNDGNIKNFLKGLRRSFQNIEVLTCLSSTCSEVYNRKCLNKYSELLDGVILTKLDLCLNFGGLLNTHTEFNNLPLKFFTTGQIIPDDIEAATKERLLNGIFKFDRK